ncbi:MAG: D-amino acid aminotransferase [Kiloniella sp.]|nr:D-amino acid aminotransferase [Kiloniella sp.]RZO30069.1 MAG: D-amino-acid transaminase [Rhodospirillaceae bacterium]
MPRTAYVNGRYLPHAHAQVGIEDRGYQFADGIYEVVPLIAGAFIDEDWHWDRLNRGLAELRIDWPVNRKALSLITRRVAGLNRVRDGLVYVQVTRGEAPRDHKFPTKPVAPALVVTARHLSVPKDLSEARMVEVITGPDERWARPDIKSISLLPNVLAKQAAAEAGAYEMWMLNAQGEITEGSSANAWMVKRDATTGRTVLRTHPTGRGILNGIVRTALVELAEQHQWQIEERAFTLDELLAADEAFQTSSGNMIRPVRSVDGRTIGAGETGPVVQSILDGFMAHVTAQCAG